MTMTSLEARRRLVAYMKEAGVITRTQIQVIGSRNTTTTRALNRALEQLVQDGLVVVTTEKGSGRPRSLYSLTPNKQHEKLPLAPVSTASGLQAVRVRLDAFALIDWSEFETPAGVADLARAVVADSRELLALIDHIRHERDFIIQTITDWGLS